MRSIKNSRRDTKTVSCDYREWIFVVYKYACYLSVNIFHSAHFENN